MADDENQIRQLLADMAAGYRAKDAERIVASYAPDLMVFNLAPPLRTGAGEQSDIGGGRKVDMATADGVRVWLAGFGDQPFDYEVSLRKDEGTWQIAHLHASVPFYMDETRRAALDLTP